MVVDGRWTQQARSAQGGSQHVRFVFSLFCLAADTSLTRITSLSEEQDDCDARNRVSGLTEEDHRGLRRRLRADSLVRVLSFHQGRYCVNQASVVHQKL